MQQSIVKFYFFVVQTLLNMFRALLCPSSGARQTAVAASGFIQKPEAATAVWRAPDGGHNNAWNMLSTVCMTKL